MTQEDIKQNLIKMTGHTSSTAINNGRIAIRDTADPLTGFLFDSYWARISCFMSNSLRSNNREESSGEGGAGWLSVWCLNVDALENLNTSRGFFIWNGVLCEDVEIKTCCVIITVIPTDVYPPGVLHHTWPLQYVVVGLPLHLMLEGTHLTLRFGICQVPCRADGENVRHVERIVRDIEVPSHLFGLHWHRGHTHRLSLQNRLSK